MRSIITPNAPSPQKDAKVLAHYRKKLAYFRSLPAHKREAELADEAEQSLAILIAELEARS